MVREVRVTAAELAEKWGRRLVQSTQDIRTGVERVSENPAEKAIAAQDKMVSKFNAAMQQGKYERAMRRVTLSDWKRATIEVGLGRIPQGVEKAQPKMQEFGRQLIEHINGGLGDLDRMPDVTLEDSISRMTAFCRHMSGFSQD